MTSNAGLLPIVAMHNFCSVSNYKLGEIAYSFVPSGLILYLIQLVQNYYFNTIWIGEPFSIISFTYTLYEPFNQKIRCKC